MLQRLADHIKACFDRAIEAREWAGRSSDRSSKLHYLRMEDRWLQLARSYELAESMERFLLNRHRAMGEAKSLPALFQRPMDFQALRAEDVRLAERAEPGKDQAPSPRWELISTAPFDQDLQLAVIDDRGPHALVFPCRQIAGGWVKAGTKSWVDVEPTHWRAWESWMAQR